MGLPLPTRPSSATLAGAFPSPAHPYVFAWPCETSGLGWGGLIPSALAGLSGSLGLGLASCRGRVLPVDPGRNNFTSQRPWVGPCTPYSSEGARIFCSSVVPSPIPVSLGRRRGASAMLTFSTLRGPLPPLPACASSLDWVAAKRLRRLYRKAAKGGAPPPPSLTSHSSRLSFLLFGPGLLLP